MSYNLTNITYVTSHLQVFDFANSVTDGWFGLGILLGIFIISLLALVVSNEAPESFVGASFITFLSALGLRASEMMTNDYVFILSLLLLVISGVILYAQRSS